MIHDFSFHHSFQEVVTRAKVACSCGAHRRAEEKGRVALPAGHVEGCPVATLYRKWTETATTVWNERLKHVRSRTNTYVGEE